MVVMVKGLCEYSKHHGMVHFQWVMLAKIINIKIRKEFGDFPGGAVVKSPPANAGDMGSIPGLGRSHMPRSN